MDQEKDSQTEAESGWSEQDISRYQEFEKTVNKIGEVISGLRLPYSPTPEIEELFEKLLKERTILEKAVGDFLSGGAPWETVTMEHYLLKIVSHASRVYKNTDKFDAITDPFIELIGKLVPNEIAKLGDITEVNSDTKFRLIDPLKVIGTYISLGKDSEVKSKAVEYYKENAEKIIEYSDQSKGKTYGAEYPILLLLHLIGEADHKQKAKDLILGIVRSDNADTFFSEFESISPSYYITRNCEDDFLKLIEDEIAHFGVNTAEVMRPWIRTSPEDFKPFGDLRTRRVRSIPKTLENLGTLGREQALVLQNEFGIHNFGRYPIEMLLKQVGRKDDISRPYGVILSPSFDRNDIDSSSAPAYLSLFEQLGDDFNLRITEVESKKGPGGILRRLAQFNNRYNFENQGHKIGFLILAGHGNREGDTIWIGDEDLPFGLKTINTSDADRAQRRNIQRYFEDHIDIILLGCYTGRKFVQKLSQILNARAFGYTGSVNRLETLRIEKVGNKVLFDPHFIGVYDPTQEQAGDRVLFDRGEQVT